MNISRAYPPAFSGAGQGAYQQLDPETREILEALITKTPQGLAQTSLETAQFLQDLQRAADLNYYAPNTPQAESQMRGRQTIAGLMDLPETLPKAAKAISEDVSGTVSALGTGLKEAVKERGLGAVAGFEDVVPFAKILKLLGAGGAAASMAGPVMGMGKQTKERLLRDIKEAETRANANKILEASAREYGGYDPDLLEATRQYTPTGGLSTPSGMFDTVETPPKDASPAVRRREALRGNKELAGYKAGQAPGESILTYDDVSQRPVVQPEEMVGGALIPMQGDRTGRVLVEQVSGIPLRQPVKAQAGPTFPVGRDDFAWASNYGIVKRFQDKARLAADATGKPVYAGYMAMAADSGNFSTPVIEIMLNQLDAIQIPKKRNTKHKPNNW